MEIQQGKRYEALGDGTSRADVLLAAASGLSRSRVAALMEQGCCTLQGAPLTKPGTKPAAGALLTLLEPPPREARPQAEDIDLEILYQDEDLAVVVKPCGMVVHPAAGNEEGTLVNALLYHLDSLSGIGGEIRPGIVHRLDKDTSGLLLVAKNDFAHGELSRQLAAREMEKHYRALVEGVMKEDAGEVALPLGRSKTDRKKMAVDPQGRDALTRWRVLARGRAATLLDVRILTGRTHQIRVHMQAMHHSVAGDPLYGTRHGVPVGRLMLHAYSLAFTHPRTGKRMAFTAPWPEDFSRGLRSAGLPGINNP